MGFPAPVGLVPVKFSAAASKDLLLPLGFLSKFTSAKLSAEERRGSAEVVSRERSRLPSGKGQRSDAAGGALVKHSPGKIPAFWKVICWRNPVCPRTLRKRPRFYVRNTIYLKTEGKNVKSFSNCSGGGGIKNKFSRWSYIYMKNISSPRRIHSLFSLKIPRTFARLMKPSQNIYIYFHQN